ncbi:MAG: replication initiation protein [Sulfurimonas sp.]|nr:replication initiation protein [Sulfurimonas sp.]
MKINNILKISSVSKHHDLVQIYTPDLGLNDYKILNFLIFCIREKKVKNNILLTTHQDINKFLGFTINHKQLKHNFIKIMGIVAELAIVNKKEPNYTLEHLVKGFSRYKGEVKVILSSDFLSLVLDNKDSFCRLNFALINSFKSKYSIRLYENIMRYMTRNNEFIHLPKMELNIFKKMMGIEANQYKRITHIQGSVIDIAVNEINAKTEIKISYELFKNGNTYTDILFHSKFKNKSSNIVEMAFFSSNENLLNFIDIFLPKYADKKVVGFIDNKSVYFQKINKIGGKKLTINDKIGETTLDMHTSMEILTNCYNNRKTFDWFDSDKYSLFCSKMKEKKYSQKFS